MKGGPHINSQDEDGNTALHYAATQGRLDFVTALVNHGARKDIPNRQGDIPRDLLPNGVTCEALVIIKQEPAEVPHVPSDTEEQDDDDVLDVDTTENGSNDDSGKEEEEEEEEEESIDEDTEYEPDSGDEEEAREE